MTDETVIALDEIQKAVFEKIAGNDNDGLNFLLTQLKDGVNFADENGMTPLQHACCKGNKEAVNILLMMGADIHFNQHGANYTPLHFAALSGNMEICCMLLDAGIDPNSVNSVFRTASQMAAFVGNHACVETIINYVPKKELVYYTTIQDEQTEPVLPPNLLDSLQKFVIEINLHPVRTVLNLQSYGLLKHLAGLKKALDLMRDRTMADYKELSEVKAFKFHYLGWMVGELIRYEQQFKGQREGKSSNRNAPPVGDKNIQKDCVELFIKRALKENRNFQLEYVEYVIRDCVREFPFRYCNIFRYLIYKLGDPQAHALHILRSAINGRIATDIICCDACGNYQPDKRCSKCHAVQYCDRECQRLHWFMHKKACKRPSGAAATNARNKNKANTSLIDTASLREELARMAIE